MTIYAGQRPTASELEGIGGRLIRGWDTTPPNTSFTTVETSLWSVSLTPPTACTVRIECWTPYDGTSGEEAKYRLKVDGVEKKADIARMKAGSFVVAIPLVAVVDLTSTAAVTISVTGVRTSGAGTIFCRINARECFVYKIEKTASGLITT